jgi:hypothetical protein
MPSRPLSADTSAMVKLHTPHRRRGVDLAKHQTETPPSLPGRTLKTTSAGPVPRGMR